MPWNVWHNMSIVSGGQGYDATLKMRALLLLGRARMAQLMTHGFRHATLFKVHLRPLSLCWLLLHLWDSAGHTAYPVQGHVQIHLSI